MNEKWGIIAYKVQNIEGVRGYLLMQYFNAQTLYISIYFSNFLLQGISQSLWDSSPSHNMPRQLKAYVSFCWFAQIFGCSLSSNMDIHPCCSLRNKPCGCPSVSCPPGRSSVSLCGDTFSLRISSPDRHCHRGDIASWLEPSLAVLTLMVAHSFPHSPPFSLL